MTQLRFLSPLIIERCVRRSGCTDYVGESNIITKEAICCDNVTDGGQITGNQSLCSPPYDPLILENTVLPTGGSSFLEYQWVMSTTGTPYSPTNPDWTLIAGANAESYDPGPLSETTYFIRLSRRHGCLDYVGISNMITITVSPEIVITLSGNDASCLGGSDGFVEVTNVTGGAPGYSYGWNVTPAQTGSSISDLIPGAYEVTVADANGCTNTGSFTVNDGPPLTIETNVTNETCVGFEDGTAMVVDVVGGTFPVTYEWNDPSGQTDGLAIDLQPGTYEVVVTDNVGCIGTGTANIAEADPLILTTSSVDATCGDSEDGSATVSVSGGVSPYQYLWNDQGSQTSATAIDLPMGEYTVTVTDANGCTATALQVVGAPMVAELSIAGVDALCFGSDDGQATATIVNGNPNDFTYLWNDAASTTTANCE